MKKISEGEAGCPIAIVLWGEHLHHDIMIFMTDNCNTRFSFASRKESNKMLPWKLLAS